MANPNWKIRRTTTLATLGYCGLTFAYAIAVRDIDLVKALGDAYQLIVPTALAVYTGGVIIDDANKRRAGREGDGEYSE